MSVLNSTYQVDSNIRSLIEKEILSQTYFQIVPVIVTNSRRDIKVHTNALLDTGSVMSLTRKDIADKLKLTGIRRTVNISNATTNTRKLSSEVVNFIVNFTITPQTNKCYCLNIDDSHVMNKLNITNNKIGEVIINKYEHLHDSSLPKLN